MERGRDLWIGGRVVRQPREGSLLRVDRISWKA